MDGNGNMIFVVDDESDVRETLVRYLQHKRPGDTVEAFPSPAEAFTAMQDGGTPDLIITDYQMDPLDGVGFARELRARGYQRPILMVTGMRMEQVPEHVTGVIDKARVHSELMGWVSDLLKAS